MGAEPGRDATPHEYVHVGAGRWRCPTCDVPIRNEDCPVNRKMKRLATKIIRAKEKREAHDD